MSGMMMWLVGSIPRTCDVAVWEGWRLEVIDLDSNRVDKVLASHLPETPDQPGGSETSPASPAAAC